MEPSTPSVRPVARRCQRETMSSPFERPEWWTTPKIHSMSDARPAFFDTGIFPLLWVARGESS